MMGIPNSLQRELIDSPSNTLATKRNLSSSTEDELVELVELVEMMRGLK